MPLTLTVRPVGGDAVGIATRPRPAGRLKKNPSDSLGVASRSNSRAMISCCKSVAL